MKKGKCIKKPGPKCNFCKSYVDFEISIGSDWWCVCPKCHAEYEVIKEDSDDDD